MIKSQRRALLVPRTIYVAYFSITICALRFNDWLNTHKKPAEMWLRPKHSINLCIFPNSHTLSFRPHCANHWNVLGGRMLNWIAISFFICTTQPLQRNRNAKFWIFFTSNSNLFRPQNKNQKKKTKSKKIPNLYQVSYNESLDVDWPAITAHRSVRKKKDSEKKIMADNTGKWWIGLFCPVAQRPHRTCISDVWSNFTVIFYGRDVRIRCRWTMDIENSCNVRSRTGAA